MADLGLYESVDDLREELQNAYSKISIFEKQIKSLMAEAEIAKPIDNSGLEKELRKEVKTKIETIKKKDDLIHMMGEKLNIINRTFNLEKAAISEIRFEVNNTKMQSEGAVKLLLSVVKKREILWKENIDANQSKVSELTSLREHDRQENEAHISKLEEKILVMKKYIEEGELDKKRIDELNQTLVDELNNRLRVSDEQYGREIEMARKALEDMKKDLDDKLMIIENLNAIKLELVERLNQAKHNEANAITNFQGVMEQQKQLQDQYSALEQELKASKKNEKQLVKDLNSNGSETGNMRLKLKEVQEKVRALEGEHQIELERLNMTMLELSSNNKDLERQLKQASEVTSRVSQRCTDMENEVTNAKAGLLSADERYETQKSRIAQLEKELNTKSTEISNLQKARCQLQEDRNEAMERTKATEKMVKNIEQDLIAAQNEIVQLRSAASKDKGDDQRTRAMADSIDSLQQSLSAKDEEIEGLRDTIRRECEERTEMLIEISDYREQIERMKRGGGAMGSSSAGTLEQYQQGLMGGSSAGMIRSNSVDVLNSSDHQYSDRLPTIGGGEADPNDAMWSKQISSGRGTGASSSRGGRGRSRR